MKTQLILIVLSVATIAGAEIVRLPARYTITSYTVHTLTGLTSGERSKNTLKVCPLAIQGLVVDGEKRLVFEKKKASHDTESDASAIGFIPYAKKADLVKALQDAKGKMAKVFLKDSTLESVFDGDDLKIILECGKPSSLVVTLGKDENKWSFQLTVVQAQQLIDVIKKQ